MREMKKSVRFLFAALLLFAVAVLGGCGKEKVTAESLIKTASKRSEKAKSMSVDMNLDMRMNIKQSGVSADFNIGADFNIETVKEPASAHMNGTMSVDMAGNSQKGSFESYVVEEDGTTVTYMGTDGAWTRTEDEDPDDNEMLSGLNSMLNDSMKYELQKETEEVNGKEAYVLTSKVSGELMNELMGGLGSDMGDLSDGIDWSKFEASVTVKLDKDSKQIAEVIMDCTDGLSAVMKDAMAQSGASDAGVTVAKYALTMTNFSYDSVDEITVPDEVRKSAVSDDEHSLEEFLGGEEDPDDEEETDPIDEGFTVPDTDDDTQLTPNADGTYTLKSYSDDASVNLAVPEGFSITPYSDPNYLYFDSDANETFDELSLFYTMNSFATDEDLVDEHNSMVEYYNGDSDYTDVQLQDKQTLQVGNLEVHYMKISYTFDESAKYIDLYGWTFLPDGSVLMCQIEEYAYETDLKLLGSDEEMLQKAFSVVQN